MDSSRNTVAFCFIKDDTKYDLDLYKMQKKDISRLAALAKEEYRERKRKNFGHWW